MITCVLIKLLVRDNANNLSWLFSLIYILQVLEEKVKTKKSEQQTQTHKCDQKLIKRVKENDSFYLKAGKGNKVVILDQADHSEH